jgi:hypothetical protein
MTTRTRLFALLCATFAGSASAATFYVTTDVDAHNYLGPRLRH